MKEILFVLLNEYADWEAANLAAEINRTDDFCIKTVSLDKKAVTSIGGFSVNIDYNINDAMATDFAGLILIGGNLWRTEEAKEVAKLVTLARDKNVLLAAICDGTVYLGANGMLNDCPHTSNQLSELQNFAKENYTGAKYYENKQAVRSGNLVTANGTANLEFTKEILIALNIMSVDEAEQWYNFYKLGFYEATKQ
ncbi:MAG: DJ-1/PfpI family protein [Oscillospiraceae bacterium]